MDTKDKISFFIASNSRFFPSEKMLEVKSKLETLNDDQLLMASTIELKDPKTLVLVSIFVGWLGVDRFMIGEVGLGVVKLLTGGVCGIWWLIDIFLIQDKTKRINYENFMKALVF